MSDTTNAVDGKKKKFKMGDPLKSPGNFGAFGGLFVLQGIISLLWGVTAESFNLDFASATFDRVTAVSTLDTANTAVCLYGIACIIGGILMLGIENIIETLKPSGRKPTIKGWITSIFGAAFISGIILLPFFIIFSIIKH
jgi:hypothetical protein